MAGGRQRHAGKQASGEPRNLVEGRRRFAARAWADAYSLLSQADAEEPLSVADLPD